MWTGVALQPVSGTSLKEVVTGSPPVGRTLSSVPEWSSFLEREMVIFPRKRNGQTYDLWQTDHTHTCTYICICIHAP